MLLRDASRFGASALRFGAEAAASTPKRSLISKTTHTQAKHNNAKQCKPQRSKQSEEKQTNLTYSIIEDNVQMADSITAVQCNVMQGKAKQCNAMRCNARQRKAKQSKAKQCKAMHSKARQGKAKQTQRNPKEYKLGCAGIM